MNANLKKWEQDRQKRIHDNKLRNVKPTIKHTHSEPAQPATLLNESLQETALYKLLKSYSLQQYAKKLAEMGYSDGLAALATHSSEELNEIYVILKVLPGHRSRFECVIELLRQLQNRREVRSTRRNNSLKSNPRQRPPAVTQQKERNTSATRVHTHNYSRVLGDALDLHSPESSSSLLANEELKLKKELEDAKAKINELTQELKKHQNPSKEKQREEEKIDPFAPLPEYDKNTREVGVSYDSAKLRSTLHHIDVEEMCFCLSKAMRTHVEHGMRIERDRETGRESLASLPELFEGTLGRSRGSSSRTSELGNTLEYSVESHVDLRVVAERSLEASPCLRAFTSVFEDLEVLVGVPPNEQEIHNFSKNMIIRGQLEKECSIICLIYIERFIQMANTNLTERNWKKLLFVTLMLASKVWDDESYENNNFAQAFTLFSLREINTIESTLLTLIDYNVGIKNSEYAKYYFILRSLSGQKCRSFPLKPLDVEVVRRLQSNSAKAEQYLKETRGDALYKTL